MRETEKLLALWVGKKCTQIVRATPVWTFVFGDTVTLVCECPWRIVVDRRIALSDEDDGQLFGLTTPVDAEKDALQFFGAQDVQRAAIDATTADLKVHFDGGTTLELWNNSRGYEAWQAHVSRDGMTRQIIAMGGGNIHLFENAR